MSQKKESFENFPKLTQTNQEFEILHDTLSPDIFKHFQCYLKFRTDAIEQQYFLIRDPRKVNMRR